MSRVLAPDNPKHQRGVATLIVALLLLSIVAVLTLGSLSYGMQSRRAISEDTAVVLAQEAAQAGLDQALQYFRAHASNVNTIGRSLGSDLHWEACTTPDRTLPCGTVPESVRASYLRSPSALNMADAFRNAEGKPMAQVVTGIDGYDTVYRVYALLCSMDAAHPERDCSVAAPSASDQKPQDSPTETDAITLVSYSTLRDSQDPARPAWHALARETIALSERDSKRSMVGIVPGSWTDVGRLDQSGNYLEH